MCGRFALGIPRKRLEECFCTPFPDEYAATYNAAPGRFLPVVGWRREHGGARAVRMLRWGLVPSWAKDEAMGNRLINARSETAAQKPSFRAAFARRRCLVPAQAFYEWQRTATGRQPYAFVPRDAELLAMAGLWEHWTAPDGRDLRTFAVLTCEANGLMRPIHDRMPVVLPPDQWDRWLRAEAPEGLLVPCADEFLTAHPVSREVNSPANDRPGLLDPVRLDPDGLDPDGLASAGTLPRD